ncbi:hypothetical protein lerEdw1_009764 [Lerista edwardsae]|nr:hypothetical protein lerEdw1_009764 [Lerista edwardsae]
MMGPIVELLPSSSLADGPRNVYVSLSPSETVTEGTDLRMLCKSDANPVATSYDWSWNGEQKLSESSRILTLPEVQVRHSGAYRCRAKNLVSIGESEPLHLTVSRESFLAHCLSFGQVPPCDQAEASCHLLQPLPTAALLLLLLCSQQGDGAEADPDRPWHCSGPADVLGARCFWPAEMTAVFTKLTQSFSLPQGDPKNDYENVGKNHEEEIHYSSLMNLARLPCPTYRDADTDSESEESIQYASLKH